MRKLLFLCFTIFLLVLIGCSEKEAEADKESLTELTKALENRWEYTNTLPDEVDITELTTAIEKELNILDTIEMDDFNDPSIYGRISSYRSELQRMHMLMPSYKATDAQFNELWSEHQIKRGKLLADINDIVKIEVDSEYQNALDDVLAYSDRFSEIDEDKEVFLKRDMLNFIDRILGKYMTIETYEQRSDREIKLLADIITDINIAVQDLEDNYQETTPGVLELLRLASATEEAVNQLTLGEYATRSAYAEDIGRILSEISFTYLDGDIPTTIQVFLGVENLNDLN